MEIIVKAAQFFLSLSILIIFHEFGHFIFARLFRTRVEKFYLFFNPWFSLFKTRKGETEFGVGWLPLGGYVKISGMIDESMDKEQMKQPPKSYEFRSKPAWQRLFIMLGGVLVNFILAFLIFSSILFVWGDQYLPAENLKYGIHADSLAREIGLESGDRIVSLDGKEVEDFSQIMPTLILENVRRITVERHGELMDIPFPEEMVPEILRGKPFISVRLPFIINGFTDGSPGKEAGLRENDRIIMLNGEEAPYFNEFREKLQQYGSQEVLVTVERDGSVIDIPVKVPESALLGIYPVGDLTSFFELERIEYSLIHAIPAGVERGVETFVSYLKQLRLIFSPQTKAYESIGGFITIGSIFPGEWDWQAFWYWTAFLSIILGIMNLLPIPALDGGHVMFLVYEIVTGRKPGEKFMEYAQIIGMLFLFSLLLYANANDIIRLFR